MLKNFFFFSTDKRTKQARVFDRGKPFQNIQKALAYLALAHGISSKY